MSALRALRTSGGVGALALGLVACAPGSGVSTHVGDWRDRVLYQIVTDRFANGDPGNDAASGVAPVPGDLARIQGGDWRGITEHLDYVADLGMSAIWISPIVRNVARIESEDGYHGYWAADFTELEPRFGTLEELRELVRQAHARDIAVIVDIVPNHAGRVFAYDLDGDGASPADLSEELPPWSDGPYASPLLWHFAPGPRLFTADGLLELRAEHFHRQGIGDLGIPLQRQLGDFPTGLRDLATEDEALRDAMVETFARWVLLTDIDGFRIDAVPHVEPEFWTRFCSGVRARLESAGKRHFFFLGEIFEIDPARIAAFTGEGQLDAGFDFPTKYALVNGVVLGGRPPDSALPALVDQRASFRDVPQPLGLGLSPWQARVTIADNHDMPRVRSEVADPFAVDQALVAIFVLDSIPGVYYGTEQELAGRAHHQNREPLWETGFGEDLPTFALLRRLSDLRRGSLALRRGDLVVRHASTAGGLELVAPPADAGLLVWERIAGAEHVLVALGTHPTITARATVPTDLAPGTALVDRLGGSATFTVAPDGTVPLEVPPRTSLLLFPH